MVIFGAPPATIVAHDDSNTEAVATDAAILNVFTSLFIFVSFLFDLACFLKGIIPIDHGVGSLRGKASKLERF
jgi:hypothetical protein